MPLLDALTTLLEYCGTRCAHRLSVLKVDRSKANPAANLAFGVYEITPAGETHTKTFFLTFMRPTGQQHEVHEESGRLNDIALNTMADLLAPNVAAANRARVQAQAEHETGPSVPPDEPLPSDETPRGDNPETTGSHQEARRERDKSQAGLESCGASSGGSSLSIRGTTDETRLSRPG
jgi:hypothetical protein